MNHNLWTSTQRISDQTTEGTSVCACVCVYLSVSLILANEYQTIFFNEQSFGESFAAVICVRGVIMHVEVN